MVLQREADESSSLAETGEAGQLSDGMTDASPSARAAVAHARLAALLQAYDKAVDAERPVATMDAQPDAELVHSDAPVIADEMPNEIQIASHDQDMPEETLIPPTDGNKLSDEDFAALSEGAEDLEDDSDQRFATRRKTKMKAIIRVTGSQDQTNCTVADISSTGALLTLPIEMHTVSRAGDHVPARFTLFMPTQRTEIDCELAWRSGNRIGARFTSTLRHIKTEKRVKPAKNAAKPTSPADLVSKLFKR